MTNQDALQYFSNLMASHWQKDDVAARIERSWDSEWIDVHIPPVEELLSGEVGTMLRFRLDQPQKIEMFTALMGQRIEVATLPPPVSA